MKMLNVLRACVGACVVAMAASGCIAPRSFVDTALGDVPASERARFAKAEPVQLMFEFQSNGKANAQGTKFLDPKVTDAVKASGLFSVVSTQPVANGALLSIVINNIPEANAAGQGFVTGLTFGAAGNAVTDFYVATGKFVPTSSASPVSTEAKHALHTVIGAKEAPANATPAKDMTDGISTIVRQLVDRVLNDLAKSSGGVTGQQQVAMAEPASAN